MNRSMCGVVVLVALTSIWSCKGDPTESLRAGEKVIADPTTVFLEQGETKFVTVQLVDGNGDQLAADFQAVNVGAGVTVVKDTTYLRTTNGSRVPTSERFIVAGGSPTSTSFEVVSGSDTLTVPVSVIPISFAATLSNPTPAANEPVTVTLPAGYKFVAGAGVSGDRGAGIVTSVAADSNSLVVVLPLGTSGPLTLDSVQAGFLPGLTLGGRPTDATITVDGTPVAGTGSTATAPSLPVPALGATTGFFDVGTFTAADLTLDGGLGAQYYRLVITDAGDYTITTDWPSAGADIDVVQCPSTGCVGASTFVGDGVSHPEQGLLTLAPGTYFLAVILFEGAPTDFSIRIDAAVTPVP